MILFRFGRSDARDDLFSSYNRSASPSKSKSKSKSPYGGGYGYSAAPDAGFAAYPGANGSSSNSNGSLYPGGSSSGGGYGVGGSGSGAGMMRSATPNSRGQYSAAVLDELESQNENEHVGMLVGKVKQLKDVSRKNRASTSS